MKSVVDRFMEYVRHDTQSDENSITFPSTAKQRDFARFLLEELTLVGLKAELDDHGYVMGTLESNLDYKTPVVGFIAHMDTTPEVSGKEVKPRIVQNYNGGDIILNAEKGILITTSVFPKLKEFIGRDLIVTDGATVLGADDKAGIAEIITAVEYLKDRPEIPHGTIRFAFTPDEEIGRGVDYFNVKGFGADFAYTLDGEGIGTFEFENFNAATCEVKIKGVSIHPGAAKGIMKNAIKIGNEFLALLPANEVPEATSDYEGFYHIYQMSGGVQEAQQKIIVRDHFKERFEKRKEFLEACAEFINKKYGDNTLSLEIRDSYYNMKEIIERTPQIIEIAEKAIKNAAIDPIIKPIRGGTDGARLSYMGLPTPNIFSGGFNVHGIYEYIPTFALEKAVEVVLNIVKEVAQIKK